jgi:hypothetical protein
MDSHPRAGVPPTDHDALIEPAMANGSGGLLEPAGSNAWPLDYADIGSPLPRPFDWDQLSGEELDAAWRALDRWVNWLRRTYGLPATVIPPAWHRHPELQMELSALHLHWQGAYHPSQHPSAPLGWHRDLADTLQRLRDWTVASGTRLDHDRPTRQTRWPGERVEESQDVERPLHDRTADFARHIAAEVEARNRHSVSRDDRPSGDHGR